VLVVCVYDLCLWVCVCVCVCVYECGVSVFCVVRLLDRGVNVFGEFVVCLYSCL